MSYPDLKIAAVASLLLFSGCGGGGSGGGGEIPEPVPDTEPPTAAIAFPITSGLWSDRATLVVHGTAEDNEGVAVVTVNGVEASSEDDYATWRAGVSLSAGEATEISVAVTDINGNKNNGAASTVVHSYAQFDSYKFCGPLAYDPARNLGYVFNPLTELEFGDGTATRLQTGLENVSGALFDSNSGQFLVIESGSLLSLDQQFQPVKTISAAQDSAIAFGNYSEIAVDESSGAIYVLNPWRSYLVRVDPATGERTEIGSWTLSDGSIVDDATSGFAIDSGRFFVTTEKSLIELEPATGSATELSGPNVGVGRAFNDLSGLSIDLAQGKAYVGDVYSELFEIDLATGDRTLISTVADGAVSNLTFESQRYGMVDTGTALVMNSCLNGQTLAIDKVSGDRSLLGEASRGGGPLFVGIESPVFDRFHGHLLVINEIYRDLRDLFSDQETIQQVVSVDPVTGDRKIVTGPYRGSGDTHGRFKDIAVDGRTGDVFTTEKLTGSIIRIDPDTGNRAVVSGPGIGIGPELQNISGLGVDEKRNRLLVLASIAGEGQGLLAVNLNTGDRSLIAGRGTGADDSWVYPSYMAVDQESDRVYISDYYTRAIYQVDLATGLKSRVSGEGIGSGPELHEPTNIALDLANNRLLVENYMGLSNGEEPIHLQLLAVDLATGDRKSLIKFVQRKNEQMVLAPAVDAQTGAIYLSMPNIGISTFDDQFGQYLMVSQ